jgi:hypothetical protein
MTPVLFTKERVEEILRHADFQKEKMGSCFLDKEEYDYFKKRLFELSKEEEKKEKEINK